MALRARSWHRWRVVVVGIALLASLVSPWALSPPSQPQVPAADGPAADRPAAPATRGDPPIAEPHDAPVAGVWKTETDDIIRVTQATGGFDSVMLLDECTSGPRSTVIRGTTNGTAVEGTMQRCSAEDDDLVVLCGLPPLWDTPFRGNVTDATLVGKSQGEWYKWDSGPNGTRINCQLDYYYDVDFSYTRLDCGVLTMEEMAPTYITDPDEAAREIALANQFEAGDRLQWSEEQLLPLGFKWKVEQFQEHLRRYNYSSTINSAYRPLLYQAHFVDLRTCSQFLRDKLTSSPDLAPYLVNSVDAVNQEIVDHAIVGKTYTVAGLESLDAVVCYRVPLRDCPHVNGRAVDLTLTPAAGGPLDWYLDHIGALGGWCRPALFTDPPDLPHWEYGGADPWTNPRCKALTEAWLNVSMDFTGRSPINLLVEDPLGRRIGHDPVTGQNVNDFGTTVAYYSGSGTEPQSIRIGVQGTVAGTYKVTGVGTGEGDYTVDLAVENDDGLIVGSMNSTGRASSGVPITGLVYTLREDYSPPQVWTLGRPVSSGGTTTGFEVDAAGGPGVVGVGGGITDMLWSGGDDGLALRPDPAGGSTDVILPRDLLQGPFTVWVDGNLTAVEAVSGPSGTTLTIAWPANAKAIVIRGTVPQPGVATEGAPVIALAAVVVAASVGIAAIVVWRGRRQKRDPDPPA